MNIVIIGKSRCGKTMLANKICSGLAGYQHVFNNIKNTYQTK